MPKDKKDVRAAKPSSNPADAAVVESILTAKADDATERSVASDLEREDPEVATATIILNGGGTSL
jgi:hypothetical protein